MTEPWDQVVSFSALTAAARRAARGKRHRPEVANFLCDLEPECFALRRALLDDIWRPGPYRSYAVYDPKPRLISEAPFPDRVVHHALCAHLEPVLESRASDSSFACRQGRGVRAALLAVQAHARCASYALRLDVRRFFHTIDHALLLGRLRPLPLAPQAIATLIRIIEHGAPGCEPGRGLPIGNLTSQHLANFVLAPVDQALERSADCTALVRYMDDFVVFGRTKTALWRVAAELQAVLLRECGQAWKPEATQLAPVRDGVPFLGFRIYPAVIRLSPRNVRRWRRKMSRAVRAMGRDEEQGGLSASGLMGWAAHADTRGLRRSYILRRLQSGTMPS